MNRSNSKGVLTGSAEEAPEIDWEMRPGGMLVQKRDPDAAIATGPLIKLKVSHGLFGHDISVSAYATFGTLQIIIFPKVFESGILGLTLCWCQRKSRCLGGFAESTGPGFCCTRIVGRLLLLSFCIGIP